MNSNAMAKRIIKNTPLEKRKIERPRTRWIDSVLEYTKRLKITSWWMIVR